MKRRTFIRLSSMAGSVILLASYPIFIERYLVQVNKYKIPIPRLPACFEGFRIVQLTDLHYGFLVPLTFLEHVIERANSIPCDIIVCTGDYVHERNSKKQIDTIWPVLNKLRAPLGKYFILGNHDHWADTDRSIYWSNKIEQNMHHKIQKIMKGGSHIWLAGAGDLWEAHLNLDRLLEPIPEQECRIVLAHNPDTADTEFKKRVDLFITGHTHGGQVNIPFYGTPILPVKNKNYSSGIKFSRKGETVFISRGIGWAIYPIRFNCNPEIAIIELTRECNTNNRDR